jgi:hypothetical protein
VVNSDGYSNKLSHLPYIYREKTVVVVIIQETSENESLDAAASNKLNV